MAALPGGEWTEAPSRTANPVGRIRHVFTHFSLDLDIVLGTETSDEGWWHPVDEIGAAGLPTLYRRAAQLVLSASGNNRAAA
jgi:A/G-specific adenine glycosylase